MEITETDRGWSVLSGSGNTYEVRRLTKLDEMGSMYFVMTCTCPAGQHRRHCKHVDAVEQYMIESRMADGGDDLEDIERHV